MEGKTPSTGDRDRPLGQLAHELRTPLTAIIGYADAMRVRAFGPLDDRYAACAEIIEEAGRHMLALTEAMLAGERTDALGRSPTLEQCDAAEAIGWALRLMARQAEAAAVAMRSVLPPSPPRLAVDRRALVQILINLLANAIRHTPSGGVIEVSLDARGGGCAMLTVSDTGPGLAPGSQTSGIGLRLVRELVEARRGAITFGEATGHGAVISIRLPIAEAVT
jgi:cell cycle sensor histidine kinase DivJ